MAYLFSTVFSRIRCLLGIRPAVSVRVTKPVAFAHGTNNIETIIHEHKTNNMMIEAERVEIIFTWVTRRLIKFKKEEIESIVMTIREYFKTRQLPSLSPSISTNPHYTKQYLTTTIYSACHAYSKSISRMDSINLAIALFSNLLEIPYPTDTKNDKRKSAVNNLYKKVDTPINIVELADFDQKHKDQF